MWIVEFLRKMVKFPLGFREIKIYNIFITFSLELGLSIKLMIKQDTITLREHPSHIAVVKDPL